MKLTWHGSASLTLRLNALEFLVDPCFSRAGDYGPWHTPNPHAPSYQEYFQAYRPDYVLISHCHFDHFDLKTVEEILRVKAPTFIGSQDVIAALKKYFSPPLEKLLPLDSGGSLFLKGVTLEAVEGIHWLTNEDGRVAAAKLDRPERYGVMPCGGPPHGFLLRWPEGTLYISGDTLLEGVPQVPVDLAIVNFAGPVPHVLTKERTKIITGAEDAPGLVDRLRPRYLVPVHYDLPIFLEATDLDRIKDLEKAVPGLQVLLPPYNQEIEIQL
ncbi:MAG: MBL fold metallo-hydrolase [Firmicutes bacterium]|nr:MBL fold metallo-hydrolase [Bacillota bacterium]MCL5039444.1 MBL fold metallo-hydrolase [Bacillota bacterium]